MLNPIDYQEGCKDNVISQEADFRLTRYPHADPASQTNKWWSVLLEIEGSIQDFIHKAEAYLADHENPAAEEESFLVPVAYDQSDLTAAPDRQPVVIFARQGFVHVLNRHNGDWGAANHFGVLTLHLGAIVRRDALDFDADWPDTSPIFVSDDAVVMAVIDDGLGIANNLFRTGPNETRVAYAAILDANVAPEGSRTSVGRILEKAQIDGYLEACTQQHLLDEDLFYTLTGQVDYYDQVFSTVALQSSHGTHVMGVAAGHPMDHHRTDRPIICAALPSQLVEDTTGVDLLPTLYLAFHMLVKQARRFRTHEGHLAPAMFNLSYGNGGGPHDGTGLFARLFDRYFDPNAPTTQEPQQLWLTVPAGNLNLSRMHGQADAGAEDTILSLSVQPDDRTATQVQIWMPFAATEAASELAEIVITSPFGLGGSIVTTGRPCHSLRDGAGREIGRLSYEYVPEPIQRGYALLSLNPTASLDPKEALAPCGTWTIVIRRKAGATEDVHAWVRRDETLPGFKPGGRQAFFSNGDYKRFGKFGTPLPVDPPDTDCPIRRSMTLSGYGCGAGPVVVAAYTDKQGKLSEYSAAGPLNRPASSYSPDRNGPDMTGKGDDSIVLRGVINAGSKSGTMVRQGGTSTAAPHMARAATEAITIPGLPAREWAQDPTAFAENLRHVRLTDVEGQDRAGSGAYALNHHDG
mmetsp:Transcript_6928/g.11034  ORF Transcript_6928/g.11034 Transcript_6928/m.11034 type:complete len:691 (-) Transcript_6928:984-3056(-)